MRLSNIATSKNRGKNKSLKEIEDEILDELEKLIFQKGTAMDGIDYILNLFKQRNIRIALASSSYMRIIDSVMNKLNLRKAFEVIHSGEFEERGKPDPAIYFSTLQKLHISANDAIAVEDSYNGLLSAKSAGLKTVVIPEKSVWHEGKFDIADLKLKSLLEFNDDCFGDLVA